MPRSLSFDGLARLCLTNKVILWHNACRLFEEQFQPVEIAAPRRRISEFCELVVNLKCYLLSLLRIHRPNCQRCRAAEAPTSGDELRRRLEELNWRTQRRSLNHGDYGEQVFDSQPGEGDLLREPISLKAKRKKKQQQKQARNKIA